LIDHGLLAPGEGPMCAAGLRVSRRPSR
jgi:hypothetical protein